MAQEVIKCSNDYTNVDQYIEKNQIRKIFLVCGNSSYDLPIGKHFRYLENAQAVEICRFQSFQPNPLYESVKEGVKVFLASKADCIMALGGGSAIDVAKCIKAFATMNQEKDYLQQRIVDNAIPLIAIPTTAGTGSEATHFAVIYRDGEKLSVAHSDLIPQTVILDPDNLKTLPLYQRQVTMMDALCHAIESIWSVHATEESVENAKKAIRMIMQHKEEYLLNKDTGNRIMLEAAYLAGRAINITKTTAAHAMSYQLTSLYHIAHGQAVAICMPEVWEHLQKEAKNVKTKNSLQIIAEAMGCGDGMEALQLFRRMLDENHLALHENITEDILKQLSSTVNVERLNNHPVALDGKTLQRLYKLILL